MTCGGAGSIPWALVIITVSRIGCCNLQAEFTASWLCLEDGNKEFG